MSVGGFAMLVGGDFVMEISASLPSGIRLPARAAPPGIARDYFICCRLGVGFCPPSSSYSLSLDLFILAWTRARPEVAELFVSLFWRRSRGIFRFRDDSRLVFGNSPAASSIASGRLPVNPFPVFSWWIAGLGVSITPILTLIG